MIFTILTTIALVGLAYLTISSAISTYKEMNASPLVNDKSKDYTRWNPADIAVAGYIGLFLDKDVRLDNYFQALVYAVLSRSERAVDEKVRRISTVGSEKSDASVADQDIAFILSSYTAEEAKQNFLNDLYTAGATVKQVTEINKYL